MTDAKQSALAKIVNLENFITFWQTRQQVGDTRCNFASTTITMWSWDMLVH